MAGSQIQFDYEKAMREARSLEEAASALDRLARRLEEALRTLSGGWQGEQAERFQRKGRLLQESYAAAAKDLRREAREVREIAEQMKTAEEGNAGLI